MFELTYSDNEIFENFQLAGKAHKGGTYEALLQIMCKVQNTV